MRRVLKTVFIITPSAFSEGSPQRGAKLDPSFLPFLFTNPILYTEHRKLIYSRGKQMCALDKRETIGKHMRRTLRIQIQSLLLKSINNVFRKA